MALSSLWKRPIWFLPLSTVSILVLSCASAPGRASPTPTVPAVYATAAAQSTVWQTLQQRPLHLPTTTPGHWLPSDWPGHSGGQRPAVRRPWTRSRRWG